MKIVNIYLFQFREFINCKFKQFVKFHFLLYNTFTIQRNNTEKQYKSIKGLSLKMK